MILSLGISGAIVAYLFAKIEWPQVWTYLKTFNPLFILALTGGFLILIMFRAVRWRLLLPNPEKLATGRLVDATILGFFASTVLPLRAGEIVRPWALSRWQPVTFSSALASIMIERLADSVCLLSLLLISLSRMPEIPLVVLAGAKVLGALTGILIAIVITSYLLPGRMESILHWFSDRLIGRFAPHLSEKINHMIVEYFAGLRVIASPWQLVKVIAWSYVMWLTLAGWYQILLWAFGEFPSLWVGLVLNVVIALAVAAPSAPGFVGTFQVGCIVALSTIFGYSKEFAMAYSVIAHSMQMIFTVMTGLLVLHLRGLTFAQLRKVDTHPPAVEDPAA